MAERHSVETLRNVIHDRLETLAKSMDAAVAIAHFRCPQHGKKIFAPAPLGIVGNSGLGVVDMEPCAYEPWLMPYEVVICVFQLIQEVVAGARRHLEGRDYGLAIAVAGNLWHSSPPLPLYEMLA